MARVVKEVREVRALVEVVRALVVEARVMAEEDSKEKEEAAISNATTAAKRAISQETAEEIQRGVTEVGLKEVPQMASTQGRGGQQ